MPQGRQIVALEPSIEAEFSADVASWALLFGSEGFAEGIEPAEAHRQPIFSGR